MCKMSRKKKGGYTVKKTGQKAAKFKSKKSAYKYVQAIHAKGGKK